MHHPLWDSLPVKVRHFIQEGKVLYGDGPPVPHCHGVGLVIDWMPVARGQNIINLNIIQDGEVHDMQKVISYYVVLDSELARAISL